MAGLRESTLALVLAACGSSPPAPPPPPPVTLAPDESAAWLEAASTLPAMIHLSRASDTFFHAGTIDPAKSSVDNAQSIFARVSENTGGCGEVHSYPASMTLPDTVYVHFGPPPGCTLATALAVSGGIGATIATTAHTTVVLYLSDTIVDGDLLLGKATFATDTGTSFLVDASFTHDRDVFVIAKFAIDLDAGGATLHGAVTAGRANPAQATFTGVRMNGRDCTPSAGTIDFVANGIAGTIAFHGGNVADVTIGAKTTKETLPAYGACR